MILKQKNIFSNNECDSIIQLEKGNEQYWYYGDRSYTSYSLIYNNETDWIFNRLKEFVEKTANVKIIKLKKEIHFHKFVKNDKFELHTDLVQNRVFAVGVSLNENYDGGDFVCYNPNKIIIDKSVGNTYLFDVQIKHEIKKVLSGIRYSLLWFLQKEHLKFESNTII